MSASIIRFGWFQEDFQEQDGGAGGQASLGAGGAGGAGGGVEAAVEGSKAE